MSRIECPRVPECKLFPLLKGGVLAALKDSYCLGKFPQCRRYQMFLRKEEVPPGLLPDGKLLPRT